MLYPHKSNSWLHYALTDGLKTRDLAKNNSIYQKYIAEKDEIERHKWLESEKAGRDIGFEKALSSWILHHRNAWRKAKIN